ncbi:hypothetical protein PR048_029179 [Dryococelus australis]|uniref:Uncharacterized protein n=1 Tax=Dryococelus australis TaxID=614101 RepID=A0ABQ9GFZ0_9NEOP|nr:hypothetical protein PR048_029179 [Dryococelus australis]
MERRVNARSWGSGRERTFPAHHMRESLVTAVGNRALFAPVRFGTRGHRMNRFANNELINLFCRREYVFQFAGIVGGNPENPIITKSGIEFGIATTNLSCETRHYGHYHDGLIPGCTNIFPDPKSNDPSSEPGSSLILVPITLVLTFLTSFPRVHVSTAAHVSLTQPTHLGRVEQSLCSLSLRTRQWDKPQCFSRNIVFIQKLMSVSCWRWRYALSVRRWVRPLARAKGVCLGNKALGFDSWLGHGFSRCENLSPRLQDWALASIPYCVREYQMTADPVSTFSCGWLIPKLQLKRATSMKLDVIVGLFLFIGIESKSTAGTYQRITALEGAAMAWRLNCLPPTKANWVQSPSGSLPDFRRWKSCRTMPLVGGFSRRSPIYPIFKFRRCPILTESVNQLIEDELTERRIQEDGTARHASDVSIRVRSVRLGARYNFISLTQCTQRPVYNGSRYAGCSAKCERFGFSIQSQTGYLQQDHALTDTGENATVGLWDEEFAPNITNGSVEYESSMAPHIAAGIPARAPGLVESSRRTKYGCRYNVISTLWVIHTVRDRVSCWTAGDSVVVPLDSRPPGSRRSNCANGLERSGSRLTSGSRERTKSGAGTQGRGKLEIPEKTRRPAASSATIPTCENTGATPPGVEPGSYRRKASALTTAPDRLRTNVLQKYSARIGKLAADSTETNVCSTAFRSRQDVRAANSSPRPLRHDYANSPAGTCGANSMNVNLREGRGTCARSLPQPHAVLKTLVSVQSAAAFPMRVECFCNTFVHNRVVTNISSPPAGPCWRTNRRRLGRRAASTCGAHQEPTSRGAVGWCTIDLGYRKLWVQIPGPLPNWVYSNCSTNGKTDKLRLHSIKFIIIVEHQLPQRCDHVFPAPRVSTSRGAATMTPAPQHCHAAVRYTTRAVSRPAAWRRAEQLGREHTASSVQFRLYLKRHCVAHTVTGRTRLLVRFKRARPGTRGQVPFVFRCRVFPALAQ